MARGDHEFGHLTIAEAHGKATGKNVHPVDEWFPTVPALDFAHADSIVGVQDAEPDNEVASPEGGDETAATPDDLYLGRRQMALDNGLAIVGGCIDPGLVEVSHLGLDQLTGTVKDEDPPVWQVDDGDAFEGSVLLNNYTVVGEGSGVILMAAVDFEAATGRDCAE